MKRFSAGEEEDTGGQRDAYDCERRVVMDGDDPLVTLFLAGDVMVGRGVDQVLPHPSHPRIHEAFLHSALDYVSLAEARTGRIAKPVDFAYIWGDALAEFDREAPDVKIINLETVITISEDYWRHKAIHYRMHPDNIACLAAAKLDCCVLANNHVLDWGCPSRPGSG